MSHTPNELHDMFPGKEDKIHTLKTTSGEFSVLHDKYHELTRAIHRAETNVEPTDDFNLEEMRKERLQLLDRISPLLAD